MDELTAEEAAPLLEVAVQTVRHWCRTDYLHARKLPGLRGKWLVPMSEIERVKTEANTR